ncbi:MAG: PAS domain S-box protein [Pseudomonadota bacterium]
MRLIKWGYLSAILFFLITTPIYSGVATAKDASTKKVLILNSYHPGYAWSDDEQAGIVDTFRARNPTWLPFIEYLDCKRLPKGSHLEDLTGLLRIKYHDQNLSVLIAMDNPALEFALKNRAKLFENLPIVFCGINDFTPAMLNGYSNVTGRAENIDIGGTIEVMLRIHPDAREILVLHDYTETGLAMRKEGEALVPRFSARAGFRFNDPLDMAELLKELERLPKGSLVLEIGFITDKSGRTFGLTETTDLFVKHSPVPVYGAYEARLGHGIIGGKLISARIHGAKAAMIALRVLAGEKASGIPVERESDAQFMFDHRAMARFGIPLSALPEKSIVINQPVSFYATHRTVIKFALAAVAFLCAIVGLLAINLVQRRRSARVLRDSEERYRALFDQMINGVAIYRPENDGEDFIFVGFNKSAERIDNIRKEDLIGKSVLKMFPGFKEFGLFDVFKRVWKTGRPERHPVTQYKDERISGWRDNFVYRLPTGEIVAVYSDETERKHAEEEMFRSRGRFEAIFNSISDGAIFTDLNRCIVMINPAFTGMFGYELDEIRGRDAAFLYVNRADYEEQGRRRFHVGMEAEKRPFEIRYRRKDGSLFDAETLGEQVKDAQGNVIGFLGIHRDITERKRAEKALRESEKKFRRLFEDDLTGYSISTEDGSILECNPAFVQLFGYENKAEVLKRNAAELYPDLSERAFILDQLRAKGRLENHETIRKRKDGSLITVIENVVPRFDEDRNLIEIKSHMYDITDRVRLMSQLRQAQKMESIGTLAGGIAHDFNNILSPIMIHSEMVMMDLPPDSPLQMNLKQIYKAGERARDLVRQILTFARKREEERIPIKISRLLKEALKLFRSATPTTIEIRYDDDSKRDTVLADPTQVHQILMNLCTNAVHSMEEKGGVLEVELRNVEVEMQVNTGEVDETAPADLDPGHYVRLTVRDTGHGIDPQVMDKIFEPYFTTKDTGKGTGMGLALVHGIVKGYGGGIRVESEPGKGSAFHVLLPVVEA